MTAQTYSSPQPGTANPADIEAIIGGYHGAPMSVLGPQMVTLAGAPGLAIRSFRPLDTKVAVVDLRTGHCYPLAQIHPGGFWEGFFPGEAAPFPYRLIVADAQGNEYELEDPYRFPLQLTDFDLHLFGEGNLFEAYRKFGAHLTTIDGVSGVHFAGHPMPNASA
jgi:1,4-alpha-glucan branching enzyme